MDDILSAVEDCVRSAGLLKNAEVYKNLADLTTTGSGGKCLCFVSVHSKSKLLKLVKELIRKSIKFMVIGDGSNIIFGDGLHKYVVLKLEGELSYLEFMKDDLIRAGAGYNLQKFMVKAARNGYNFSFLGGIPGTIGGAVLGNSGTASTGINNYVEAIDYLSKYGEKIEKKHLKLKPGNVQYRSLHIDNTSIITDITIRGKKSGKHDIFHEIRSKIKQKKRNQPTNTKNAGCFFKNPANEGLKAGELIDSCRLKGFSYGGARISEKHANFIDNFNNTSSKDIYVLSKIVRDSVKEKYGVELEYEVTLVGLNEQ
jgi:UDP-N-acetylmuramate dehydrogenase